MFEYENFIKIIAFIMISKSFFYLISFSTKKLLFHHWIIFCWCSYYFLYFIKFLENSLFYWSYEDYHYAIIKFDFFFFWSIKKQIFLCSFFHFFLFIPFLPSWRRNRQIFKLKKIFCIKFIPNQWSLRHFRRYIILL